MKILLALIITSAVGVSLIALGVSIFMYGLRQPIVCRNYAGRGGCGNLPLVLGVFITFTGVATLSGAIIYAVKVKEGLDGEVSND
jgi:hypothetical protein